MTRFLARIAVFLGSAAIGLLVAALLVSGMHIDWRAFIAVVVAFAVLQSLLTPLITSVARDRAPALVGLAGLLSTTIALVVATLVFERLRIDGVLAWVLTPVIVWLVTLLAAVLLPKVFGRRSEPRTE